MKGSRFSETVKEYVRKLSDDDLRFLHFRLSQRIGSDVGEAVELLQRNPDVDYWFGLSKNANDFFDMLDVVDATVQGETKRRFATHEKARVER